MNSLVHLASLSDVKIHVLQACRRCCSYTFGGNLQRNALTRGSFTCISFVIKVLSNSTLFSLIDTYCRSSKLVLQS